MRYYFALLPEQIRTPLDLPFVRLTEASMTGQRGGRARAGTAVRRPGNSIDRPQPRKH